ncbi:MAG: hypothetical protein LBK62_10745 [Treponema sp.]|nr:hypothetical protein [Treponema sp.]
MKKTLMRLGVLAAALALTFVFVSCAQPTEEGSSGPNAPTIIRLYLDRDDATLAGGDHIQFRVGEELLIPVGVTQYPVTVAGGVNTDAAGTVEPGSKSGNLEAGDRTRVIAISWERPTGTDTILNNQNPKKKFLDSGEITILGSYDPVAQTAGGNSIQVNAKNIYYVDVELVTQTPAAKDRGSIFDQSISGYLELDVSQSTTGDSISTGVYMYTKDKHGFNDLWKMENGLPLWKSTNANIKKVSLKPGLNEIYLSYFSTQRATN